MERLISLYNATFGHEPNAIMPLSGAGSNRRYYRLGSEPVVIGTIGTDIDENNAFFYWNEYFYGKGLPVPRLIAKSSDGIAYLQEDLGNISLYDLIRTRGIDAEEVRSDMVQCMRILPEFQYLQSEKVVSWDMCFPRASMDKRAIMWDLNYFKYCFLKVSGMEFSEESLENDFDKFAGMIIAMPANSVMLRDFQSRNVMIRDDRPWFIDFQGARRGPALYDVASFLWQVRAGLPAEMQMELAEVYRNSMEKISGIVMPDFYEGLYRVALFRTMQVLGAYGFRGYVERKAQFLTEISGAVRNVKGLLAHVDLSAVPYLKSVLTELCSLPRFVNGETYSGLTVKVVSFSYKKGIPEDYSGNGGGFVFDCRAVHNPGRYDEYKSLTGMDMPVIEFLERDGEMSEFLENCYNLVDCSVSRYLKRGFTNLMVCFGCTGGQHRSVYGAQHLAEHVWRKFGVRVELIHREQCKTEIFDAV